MYYLCQVSTDLFGRLSQLLEIVPLAGFAFLGAVAMLLMWLAFSRHAFWLLILYVILCQFSANSNAVLDVGSTLARWWIIICFCLSTVRRSAPPGLVCSMLGGYWVYSLMSVLWSPNPRDGFQVSVLAVLLALGASRAISDILSDGIKLNKFFKCFSAISILFILMAVPELGGMSGSRFGGASESAALFSITGGAFLPVLVWRIFSSRGVHKYIYTVCFASVCILLIFSSQRTGLYAALISCVPIVMQFNFRALRNVLTLACCLIYFIVVGLNFFPDQKDFLTKRYFGESAEEEVFYGLRTSTTGRAERWMDFVKGASEMPLVGHGAMAHKVAGKGGVHNAYLQEWYNGGLIGIVFFLGASIVALVKGARVMSSNSLGMAGRQMCRLLFSMMLFLVLVSLFESKLSSPSNIMIFIFIVIGASLHRVEVMLARKNRALKPPKNL